MDRTFGHCVIEVSLEVVCRLILSKVSSHRNIKYFLLTFLLLQSLLIPRCL